ncbi:hypothetical protein C6497_01895 [Candidatus Poribacteria bacterium]|nr:MAG: hypothetical protein C6497_01895 [Candidatus Poribacteria bacterium]
MRIAVLTLTFLFLISCINTSAEEVDSNQDTEFTTLSGTVVDLDDNPITDVSISIMPMKQVGNGLQPIDNGRWGRFIPPVRLPIHDQLNPNNDEKEQNKYPLVIKTDQDGKFTTNKLPEGFIQLRMTPDESNTHMADKEIVSVQIGKITLYENEHDFGPDEKLSFKLESREVFENIKISVRQLLKIKAQVVSKDGQPIKNTRIRLSMILKGDQGSGSYGTSVITDDSGHFTYYRNEIGIYTVSVEYQNFKGGVTPFQLDYETPAPENLVIKLDGNPTNNNLEKLIGTRLETGKAPQAPPNVDPLEFQKLIQQERQEQIIKQKQQHRKKEVWIINPANGHAYKKIQCENWHDAQQTAIDELAHLVSINDVNEQLWLQTIFGRHPYWIGLNDIEEEGVWKWDSGEPVNYTNWTQHEVFGSTHTDAEKDYVAMTFHFGAWQSVAPDGKGGHSPLWHITRHAIIEKDGLISKKPKTESNDEE